MKNYLLIASLIASLTGFAAQPSFADADVSRSVDPVASSEVILPIRTPAPGSASLAAPLRPAIVTPAVSAPTQTNNGGEQGSKRHLRIGLPGLFHINMP